MTTVGGLPKDIWVKIGRYFKDKDYQRFRLVCKAFHNWTVTETQIRLVRLDPRRCPVYLPKSRIRCPLEFPCVSHDEINVGMVESVYKMTYAEFKRERPYLKKK